MLLVGPAAGKDAIGAPASAALEAVAGGRWPVAVAATGTCAARGGRWGGLSVPKPPKGVVGGDHQLTKAHFLLVSRPSRGSNDAKPNQHLP